MMWEVKYHYSFEQTKDRIAEFISPVKLDEFTLLNLVINKNYLRTFGFMAMLVRYRVLKIQTTMIKIFI